MPTHRVDTNNVTVGGRCDLVRRRVRPRGIRRSKFLPRNPGVNIHMARGSRVAS